MTKRTQPTDETPPEASGLFVTAEELAERLAYELSWDVRTTVASEALGAAARRRRVERLAAAVDFEAVAREIAEHPREYLRHDGRRTK